MGTKCSEIWYCTCNGTWSKDVQTFLLLIKWLNEVDLHKKECRTLRDIGRACEDLHNSMPDFGYSIKD